MTVTSTPALTAPAAAGTSSIAMCPCPRPRVASVRKLPIARRVREPVAAGEAAPRDPSAETGRYLRDEMRRLASCAPATGGSVRLHLEVTVAPSGAIQGTRITNLDPLPAGVASCAESVIRGLSPPGFDASEAEVFALTVVL